MQKSTQITKKEKSNPKPKNLKVTKLKLPQQKTKSAKPAKTTKQEPVKPVYPKSNAVFSAEIMDSFPQYNLVAERIIRNGNPVNTQIILKDDKHVHSFTESYKVIPNEEALKIAEMVKKDTNLIYAKDMKSDWKGMLTIPTFMGSVNKAVTCLLIDPKEVNLSAGTKYDDDWIRMGIGIGNSIDGSSSLKSFGFTFRKICGNYAFHHFHLGAIKVDADINPGEFNDAKTLNKAIFVHARNIDIKKFEDSVREVLKAGKLIVKRYQAMRIEVLLEKQALEIARRMPKTAIKDKENPLSWIRWDKKLGAQFVKGVKVNKFDAFNDVTDRLSHAEGLSYRVQMNGFKRLDRILVAPVAK